MRRVVSVLIVISLMFVAGCDRNDEDVINSIPKSHIAYPVFKLAFDNGYQAFGVDSALVTVTPSIGWLDSVFTNEFGQLPTQSGGTFVTDIDTLVGEIDTVIVSIDTLSDPPDTTFDPPDTTWVIDTSFVNFGFIPSLSYSFSFQRPDPYMWVDSFRVDFLTNYDSVWCLLSADTQFVMTLSDTGIAPITIIDSVSITTAFDTLNIVTRPDSVYVQEVFKASWLDTTYVLSSADDTLAFPPDSFFTDTLIWGFWNAIDSFFVSFDSGDWCPRAIDSIYDTTFLDDTIVVSIDSTFNDFFVYVDSVPDIHGFYVFFVDTVIEWVNDSCDVLVDSTQMRVYSNYGWSQFDTTYHFTFPDTTKGMLISPTGVDIFTWQILPDSSDTISDTTSAAISLITTVGTVVDTTTLNDLTDIPLTMPAVEVYPDYRIMITDN